MRPPVMAFVLAVVLVGSAVDLVLTRHRARDLFSELEELRRQQHRLNEGWGRLMLERATWSTHGRIEKVAREQLDMVVPETAKVILIQK